MLAAGIITAVASVVVIGVLAAEMANGFSSAGDGGGAAAVAACHLGYGSSGGNIFFGGD